MKILAVLMKRNQGRVARVKPQITEPPQTIMSQSQTLLGMLWWDLQQLTVDKFIVN